MPKIRATVPPPDIPKSLWVYGVKILPIMRGRPNDIVRLPQKIKGKREGIITLPHSSIDELTALIDLLGHISIKAER